MCRLRTKGFLLLICFFVVLFLLSGCKLNTDKINVDLSGHANSMVDSDAYAKGWVHYFSYYSYYGGTVTDAPLYFDYYKYGRSYDTSFDDNFSAFSAGFKDAYYLMYHKDIKEPEETDGSEEILNNSDAESLAGIFQSNEYHYYERMINGYKNYYPEGN